MEKNVIQINGGITINDDVSVKYICGKYCIWNTPTCSCENRKYVTSIMNDSAIKCDEIIVI